MNNKLNKESCVNFISNFGNRIRVNANYIFDIYDMAYDGIIELLENQNLDKEVVVDSYQILFYILGEYTYSTNLLNDEDLAKFIENEKIKESMASVAADKYLSLSIYNHQENKFTNKYLPPISSMSLYVNLMLNIVSIHPKGNPSSTLINDLLIKSLSISRSIITLLCEGYETEAFAVWRTIHECECTLILLEKYGDLAINSYLKHMRYGLAYRQTFEDKEEETRIIMQIKEEMNAIGLKSKDMKKYIEYGWMNVIPESQTTENYKLNFRDGLETLAGLHQYSSFYMMSSEILHSTPLLIYSNKQYFFYITILNLYESFFRIEKVFVSLFINNANEAEKEKYIEMRKLYYSQLVNIHKRETINFHKTKSKNNKKT